MRRKYRKILEKKRLIKKLDISRKIIEYLSERCGKIELKLDTQTKYVCNASKDFFCTNNYIFTSSSIFGMILVNDVNNIAKYCFSEDRIIIVTSADMEKNYHWLEKMEHDNIFVIEIDTLEHEVKDFKDSSYLYHRMTNILGGKETPFEIVETVNTLKEDGSVDAKY